MTMSDATKTNEAVKVAESATKESAKPKVSGKSEGYIAVVQVRGLVGVKASVRDTLRMLGLNRVNQCVLVKNSQSLQGMLLKVKDYATYGPVSEEVIKELISKRGSEYAGRLQDAKGKYSYSSFDYAGPMTETVLMGNLAIRSYMLRKEKSNGGYDYYARKKLLWDGENMKITNIEAANQYVTRNYREGWKI